MDNKKTMIIVIAALGVGFMVGALGPKLFSSRPRGTTVVPQTQFPVPPVQSPVQDNSLKIAELKRILEKNPNDIGTLIQLGNTYFDSNMYVPSIEAYERALALKPGNPDVLTDLGVMYRRNGQPGEAVLTFRKAMKASSTHPQSRFNLGIVLYYDLRDINSAKEAFQDFLTVVPAGPQADNVKNLIAEMESQK